MKIFCVECQKFVETELVTGKEIYPKRPDLHKLYFYQCPKCGNYVECHPRSTRPLGCIPNEELKKARQLIHERLYPLLQTMAYGRSQGWWAVRIGRELGIKEYYPEWTSSIEECRKVWRVITIILNRLKENRNYDE